MELDGHKLWVLLRSALLVAAGLYIIFAILLSLFQSKFVYYPTRNLDSNPAKVGLVYESVGLTTEDGVPLLGWFVPHDSARATILLCHGNGGNISHRVDLIKTLHDLNLNVFIIDYRGYGQSEGKPSEDGTYKDARAAWLYLVRKKQIAPSEIIVHGRSLGGPIAACLAKDVNPGALIVESSFTRAKDIASRMFPFFPVRLMIRYDYSTIDYITECKCPVLVIHSRDDDLIPFEFGEKLYGAAHQPKSFLEISGSHDDGYLVSGESYTEGINEFLDSALK